MTTECNPAYLDFPMLGPRQVLADFDGGAISSDGGALLLRQVEALTGIVRQFAACFDDHRDPDLVEHEERLLGAALRGIVESLPEGGRALVVGHSPTNEAAVAALTGETVAPLGKGAGVLLVEDGGTFSVRTL